VKGYARTMRAWVGGLAVGAVCAGPRPAQAQDGGRESPVYCASNGNQEARCSMPWRDSVLLQQLSRAPCDEGIGWGTEPYAVWIKKGCRGTLISVERYRSDRADGIPVPADRERRDDFRETRDSASRRGHSHDNRSMIRCESRGRARRYCGSNIDRYDVTMATQISSERCVRSYNWDVAGGSIWVDSGCGADFEVR